MGKVVVLSARRRLSSAPACGFEQMRQSMCAKACEVRGVCVCVCVCSCIAASFVTRKMQLCTEHQPCRYSFLQQAQNVPYADPSEPISDADPNARKTMRQYLEELEVSNPTEFAGLLADYCRERLCCMFRRLIPCPLNPLSGSFDLRSKVPQAREGTSSGSIRLEPCQEDTEIWSEDRGFACCSMLVLQSLL